MQTIGAGQANFILGDHEMYIVDRTVRFARGFMLSYGPSAMKKRMWDKEFSGTKWDFINDTAGDCIYPYLEKYANNGDILDLGCGPGNTANELAVNAYQKYIGVDISEAALAKARKRTAENDRSGKNSFVNSDFLNYEPDQKFDVILFRESMYHIPYGQVLPILKKFAKYLKGTGVFVVRLYAADNKTGVTKTRVTAKLDLIKREFNMVESGEFSSLARPNVLVFRP
jgi:SAM-dependent methyltransferase